MTLFDLRRAGPTELNPIRAAILIALSATALTVVWMGLGLLSLPGLVLALFAIVGGLAWLLHSSPQTLVVVAPVLIPAPILGLIFPYELAFIAVAGLLLLRMFADRSPWLTRLETLEVVNLTLVAWALFSGLWSSDLKQYMLGIRWFSEGFISYWVAFRLARYVPRSVFELSLLAGGTTLALTAVLKRMSTGMTEEQLRSNRAAATNLEWGTANFIATLLLLLGPPILCLAMRSRQRWLRIPSWPAIGLIGLLQVMIASRAATVLFAVGALVQVAGGQLRRRWASILAIAALFSALLASPIGTGFLLRFTSPHELGSMTVRIWYFREAWRRTLANLPWGIGLNQGIVYPDHLGSIDPHNYWLSISSQLGIPGLILWIAVLALIWRRISRLAASPEWREVGRALQVTFWLSQFHTLVEPTFPGSQYQFLYFWIIGGYLGYFALSREAGQGFSPVVAER